MGRRRFLWLGLAGAGIVAADGLTWSSFSSAVSAGRERIRGRSKIFAIRCGDMEYAKEGAGLCAFAFG